MYQIFVLSFNVPFLVDVVVPEHKYYPTKEDSGNPQNQPDCILSEGVGFFLAPARKGQPGVSQNIACSKKEIRTPTKIAKIRVLAFP